MHSPIASLRHLLRRLALTPTFTLVTVLTLGIALAANAAVFAVVNGVLLKPLPFPESERLVSVWHTAPGLNFDQITQSPALHFVYRDDNRSFDGIGMWAGRQFTITGLEEPEVVPGMAVTADIFALLRVQPLVGRLFRPDDDVGGAAPTAVLGERYWRERFGADPSVVGRTVRINGTSTEIIGVYPAGHELRSTAVSVYVPFRWDLGEVFVGNFSYRALARLRPDVTIEQASADIERMWPTVFDRFSGGLSLEMLREARFAPDLRPFAADVVGDIGTMLWVVLGAVGLVLAIACANVANLFLVRAEARHLETAVRSALGASRGRLIRESLIESLTLSSLGGALGLGLAAAGLAYLVRNAPRGLPRAGELGVDPGVVAFTAALTFVAGLVFGLVPALRGRGEDLAGSLKEGGRGGSAGRERHRARNALVIAQVALALMLLVGSGLMIRTFQALRAVDPGFGGAAELLTLRLSIPEAEMSDPLEVAATHQAIRERLEALPGVEAVGQTAGLPMSGFQSGDPVYVDGFPIPDDQLPPIRRFHWVGDGYFAAMQIPVVAGRELTRADLEERADVVMVSESFALEHWDRAAEAVGNRLRLPTFDGLGAEVARWRTIVGVAADVRDDGVDQDSPSTVYWPLVTNHFWDQEIAARASVAYAIRSARVNESGFLDEVRRSIWSVNSNLPLANVQTMDAYLAGSMARTSFTLTLLVIAAGVALVLGTVGIYGVTSYVVAQRTREIGVRMALGARSADVAGMVLRQGMITTAIGVGLGLFGALGLTRLMAALLFGVAPVDPVTYAAVAVVLTAIAAAACWLPARRAAAVEPVVALRAD